MRRTVLSKTMERASRYEDAVSGSSLVSPTDRKLVERRNPVAARTFKDNVCASFATLKMPLVVAAAVVHDASICLVWSRDSVHTNFMILSLKGVARTFLCRGQFSRLAVEMQGP